MSAKCTWCGRPAVGQVVSEPDRYGFREVGGRRVRVLVRRAILADACREHIDILNRQGARKR